MIMTDQQFVHVCRWASVNAMILVHEVSNTELRQPVPINCLTSEILAYSGR